MALPHQKFQQHYSSQQQQRQPPNPQPSALRNLYTVDGQNSPAVAYYKSANLQDQSQHPPYIPPFHVFGFAPAPTSTKDCSNGGADFQYNYGFEPKRERAEEHDFLENSSQISSIDFLGGASVSTGLGLSLDNTRRASSGDSPLLSLIGNDIDLDIQSQDMEIDRFLKDQGDRLRQTIMDKVQKHKLQALSLMEEKVLQKLREKEAEVDGINRRNIELEEQIDRLVVEAGIWQQRAKSNENIMTNLKYNLQQAYAQNRDNKEGCGDSEVDDTASCYNSRGIDFHPLNKESKGIKELMRCKICRVKGVCMLLLPCKHLCLCKDCESKVSLCPLCQSSKLKGMEVYM